LNVIHDTKMAAHENFGDYFQNLSTSYRLVNSTRVCLATAACVCVSTILQIPLAFESVIGVLVLFSVYPGLVFRKGVERVLGRLVGILAALVLSEIFFEVKLLYVVSMTLVLFWGLYRMLEQKTPYASGHAGLTAVIMMVVATASPLQVKDFAYHWWFQVALGVTFAVLVARLIPLPTGPALDAGIAGFIAKCSCALEASALAFEKTGHTKPAADGSGPAPFSDLMKLVEFERTREEHGQVAAESYRRLLAHTKVLYVKLQRLHRENSSLPNCFSDEELQGLAPAIMRALARRLKDVVQDFSDNSEIVRDPEAQPLLVELTGKLDALRSEPPSGKEERDARKDLAVLVATLKDISEEVTQIQGLAREARCATVQTSSAEPPVPKTRASGTSGFNPKSARKAFRATASIIALALGLMYIDLPGGGQVLIAALIVGGQANLGRSMLKWRLRLLGVVTGAVYGFGAMVIVSYFPHFPVMLCLLLVGIFIGSYVALGDDRFSYAGLQMALVVPLVLVYEAGPPAGLGEVESRFWGALLGGIVATVAGHLLWPDDPVKELRVHLGTMLERCAVLFRSSLGLEPSTREPGTPLADMATTGMHRNVELLADARRTWASSGLGLDSYARMVHIVGGVITDLTVLSRLTPQVVTNPGLQDFIAEMAESVGRVASDFDLISTRLMSSGRETPLPEAGSTADGFRLAVERYRETGRSLARSSDTVAALVLICETIERICDHLNEIADTLDAIETFNPSPSEPSHG
jgi:uncharacterized membrane protein YccC